MTVATFPNDARAADAAVVGAPVTHTAKRSKAAAAARALLEEARAARGALGVGGGRMTRSRLGNAGITGKRTAMCGF